MIAIIDYGVGNLFSLCGALSTLGANSVVSADPAVLEQADRIILPGVGAFGDAVAQFRAHGLEGPLKAQVEKGKPLLGICVGLQIMFETGYEFGVHEGLGYLAGSIHSLLGDIPPTLKIPHIGWNSLQFKQPGDPLLAYIKQGDYVYYVHSFYAKDCTAQVVAGSEYGVFVPSIFHEKNVYGTQFHPEKSGHVGQNILRAFCEVT